MDLIIKKCTTIVPSFLHELCFKQWNYEENETKYQPVHEGRGLQKCMILNYSQNGRPDLIIQGVS
jgi:hypothetical protein